MPDGSTTPHFQFQGGRKRLFAVSWRDWPYALFRNSDGTWLAVNRDYVPLGEEKTDWVDYDTHPARQALAGLTTALVRRLSIESVGDEMPKDFYLYDDSTSPRRSDELWQAYLEKLALLVDIGLEIPAMKAAKVDPPTPAVRALRRVAKKKPRPKWRAPPQWRERF